MGKQQASKRFRRKRKYFYRLIARRKNGNKKLVKPKLF